MEAHYGNIMHVDTTGASLETGKQEGLTYGGGISSYNAGTKNVQTYDRLDVGTTKNDYANDVVARAMFYKRNGY
ncbi:hypothetical protein JD844_032279 [Phrynosoma platyrhinos]|uniref:Uncharacterized protein n=1 Tax=Phrynosoma platyrhinos TaxID=52577 RepID=A0ABQ7T511_PHRPL|nr:hypothetical protein JD844_032279 [Phrynosoma platyrhinos]